MQRFPLFSLSRRPGRSLNAEARGGRVVISVAPPVPVTHTAMLCCARKPRWLKLKTSVCAKKREQHLVLSSFAEKRVKKRGTHCDPAEKPGRQQGKQSRATMLTIRRKNPAPSAGFLGGRCPSSALSIAYLDSGARFPGLAAAMEREGHGVSCSAGSREEPW